MFEVRHYLSPDGKDHFLDWVRALRDITARIAIDRRINRIEQGNFGDRKFLRDGVSEIRVDVGPGYRVYITQQKVSRSCCCSVAGISGLKIGTLNALAPIGGIGRGG